MAHLLHIAVILAVCVKEHAIECTGLLNHILPSTEEDRHVWELRLAGSMSWKKKGSVLVGRSVLRLAISTQVSVWIEGPRLSREWKSFAELSYCV